MALAVLAVSVAEIIPGNGAGRQSHDWPLDLPTVDRREGTSGAFPARRPGMPSMYLAHAFQRPLEKDFIVVSLGPFGNAFVSSRYGW